MSDLEKARASLAQGDLAGAVGALIKWLERNKPATMPEDMLAGARLVPARGRKKFSST